MHPDSSSPQLVIISPKDNVKIFGDKVTVSFFLKNFTTQEGYILVWVDTPDKNPAKAMFLTSTADFTLENLGEGPHILTLELVTTKGASLSPPVAKSIIFQTVENIQTSPIPTTKISPTVTPSPLLPPTTLLSSSFLVIAALICIFSAIWLFRKTNSQ